jgi:hypothetical protein
MNTKVNMEEIRRDPVQWRELKKNQIRGDLFDKGMFDDLVYEGWDDPQELRREYKKDPETKQRQIDGVVFVAASTQKQLEKAVGLVKEKLHMRDIDDDIGEDAACKLILTRKGMARPDQLKGKEQYVHHGESRFAPIRSDLISALALKTEFHSPNSKG